MSEVTDYWKPMVEKLQAELKQLRAELEKLRAERAELLEWLDGHTKLKTTNHTEDGWNKAMQAIKSKLTDSAQKVEPQELQEFRKTMREEVIPEIEKTVRNRQAAANKLDGVLYGDPAQIQKGENHD